MKKIVLLLTLFLLLLPTAVFAQEGGEEEPAPATESTIPAPTLAIAAHYALDVAAVQSLQQAGIGYGLMFKLLPLVQSGEMTVEEIIAWKSGESQGMGALLKLGRVHLTRGENLGSVMRAYAHARREERRNQQGEGSPEEGSEQGNGRPEHAGPPDHAQGQGQGNGNGNQGNGQGGGNRGNGNGNQGNGNGNGGGKKDN